jgi:hypothetical protein
MLQMIERGHAWFECQKVGTKAFETGLHVPMGSAALYPRGGKPRPARHLLLEGVTRRLKPRPGTAILTAR